ncbi:MAG: hypothetical protein MUC98_11550 [Desulfobacterota bacterium]|nr:hypothetical protein [Thermodesulfobacteriota bacterium]
MKWLETIKVRLLHDTSDPLIEEILRSALAGPGCAGLKEVKLHRNAALATDLCLSLHWEKKNLPILGSTLGLCLAENLKEFGLVHHTVWVEEAQTLT